MGQPGFGPAPAPEAPQMKEPETELLIGGQALRQSPTQALLPESGVSFVK